MEAIQGEASFSLLLMITFADRLDGQNRRRLVQDNLTPDRVAQPDQVATPGCKAWLQLPGGGVCKTRLPENGCQARLQDRSPPGY